MASFRSLIYKGLFSILFISLSSFLYAAPVGKFTYLKGRVDVTSPGKKAIPAKPGMPVSVGDIIRAKSRSKAEITFNNGNILRLAQNTRVEITEYMVGEKKSSNILNLFRGKIQNIVQKKWASKIAAFGKAHKFEVHTPIAVVGVKGTNFFTFHTHLGSGAVFKEGTGYVYPKQMPQKRVYVFPGQRVFIPSATATPKVKSVPKTEIERYEKDTAPEKGVKKEKRGAPERGAPPGKGKKGPGGKEKPAPKERAPAKEGAPAAAPPPKEPEAELGAPRPGPAPAGGTEAPAAGREGTKGERVYIPVTETEPKKTLDTTPPKVTLNRTPKEKTNSRTALFEWSADEPATFYYRVDGGSWVSTTDTAVNISHLAEGHHIFAVKAKDRAGNESSPEVYSWTTDYTSPDVVVDPSASPEAESKSRVVFDLKSSEPTTYSWNFDGMTGTAHGTTLSFSSVDEGGHLFRFEAKDEAGNTTRGEISFALKRYHMNTENWGGVTGEGSAYTGQGQMEVSAVIDDNWGGWEAEFGGTYDGEHQGPWHIYAGGESYDSDWMWRGYWMYQAWGNYAGTDMEGDAGLRVLTYRSYGEGEGLFSGSYNDLDMTWDALSFGDYSHNPLAYSGYIDYADDWSEGPYFGLYGDNGSGGFEEQEDVYALVGGVDSPWTGNTAIYAMGEYYAGGGPYIWNDDIYSYNINRDIHSTYDDGTFKGFVGGVWLPGYHQEGDIDGIMVAIYRAPGGNVGYMKGHMYGGYVSDIGMMYAKGSWEPCSMTSYPDINPQDFYNSIVTDYNMTASVYGRFADGTGAIDGINFFEASWTRFLNGENWGMFDLIIDGYDSYHNPDNEAVWSGDVGGTANFGTYQYNNGQYFSDFGYWIAHIPSEATWQDGKITASIEGRFLTYTKMGTITGDMLGYYDDQGHWAATALGVYEGSNTLAFFSGINDGDLFAMTSNAGTFDAIMGGYLPEGGPSRLWNATEANPASLIFMGKLSINDAYKDKSLLFGTQINSYNPYDSTHTTPDGGAYWGWIGGIIDDVEGNLVALYIDPDRNAGILKGAFTGQDYREIRMWEADGSVFPVQLSQDVGFDASELTNNVLAEEYDSALNTDESVGTFDAGGSIQALVNKIRQASLSNQAWGIWQEMIGGTYSGDTSDIWESYLYARDDTWEAVLVGYKWSENIIRADVAGAWVSWDEAITGVSGGKLVGTFDPTNLKWQAIAQGVGIETTQFLQMINDGQLAKLQQLNIPCFEIGRTTLTGSGGNLTRVTMQDVIFFASQSGGAPRIWATNGVSGSYSGNPSGSIATLNSQAGGTANFNNVQFKMTNWNTTNDVWAATVDGSNGTVGSYTGVTMKGAAAGRIIDSSNFSGTASGIAHQR